jgi:hypothetical protein
MAALDQGFATLPAFLIVGASAQGLAAMAVSLLKPIRLGALVGVFAHLFLLLAVVAIVPIAAELSWDATYSHYHLQPDEAPGPLGGPEGLVWGLLLLFGIGLFVIYEFTNFAIWYTRRLRDADRIRALAKETP